MTSILPASAPVQCPWCGPNGLPLDVSLPASSQACSSCRDAMFAFSDLPPASCLRCRQVDWERGPEGYCLGCCEAMQTPKPEVPPHVAGLRSCLRRFVGQGFYGTHADLVGNVFLDCLADLGYDPAGEIQIARAA